MAMVTIIITGGLIYLFVEADWSISAGVVWGKLKDYCNLMTEKKNSLFILELDGDFSVILDPGTQVCPQSFPEATPTSSVKFRGNYTRGKSRTEVKIFLCKKLCMCLIV